MGRLESIKERAKITEHLNDDRADVNYLLSKLEIAQKAIEWYADYRNYTKQDGLIENTSVITSHVQLDQGTYARKALDQLKE